MARHELSSFWVALQLSYAGIYLQYNKFNFMKNMTKRAVEENCYINNNIKLTTL